MGMQARVRLVEATPVTGGLRLELLDATGIAPRGPRRKAGGPPRKKLDKAKIARAKARKKARR